MLLRISIWDSEELQTSILLMRGLDRDIAAKIRKVTKAAVLPLWLEAVGARVETPLEAVVLANTATVAVGDSNVILKSATKGRALSGGGTPPVLAHGTEFGSEFYHQFPARRKAGPVYSAASAVIPKVASLWGRTVVQSFFATIPDKE